MLKRPSRTRILVSIGVAAVVALGIGLMSIATGGWPGDDDQAVSAGGEIPVIVAMVETGRRDIATQQLWLTDITAQTRRTVGEPDSYSAVALSPDGRLLAALATPIGPNQGSRLHLISTVDGETLAATTLPEAAAATFPAWSPDGRFLAITGGAITILAADGTTIATMAAPDVAVDGGYSVASGGYAWSPDSTTFASVVNGRLLIATATGATNSVPVADPVTGERIEAVLLHGWQDAATLILQQMGAAGSQGLLLAVEVRKDASLAIRHTTTAPAPRSGPAVADEEIERLVPDGNVIGWKTSSDGAFDVFEVRIAKEQSSTDESAPLTRSTLIIRDRVSGELARVDGPTAGSLGGWLFDVARSPK